MVCQQSPGLFDLACAREFDALLLAALFMATFDYKPPVAP